MALNHDPRGARIKELGSRREVARRGRAAVKSYGQSLGEMLERWRELLVPEGRIYLVIGDGQHSRGTIDVLKIVEEAASVAGLILAARASQARSVFGSMKGREEDVRWEHVLALEVAE